MSEPELATVAAVAAWTLVAWMAGLPILSGLLLPGTIADADPRIGARLARRDVGAGPGFGANHECGTADSSVGAHTFSMHEHRAAPPSE